jgi:hypothetical protein
MTMERSTVLSRPKSHAGRRRIVTVLYALASRSGIGGFHSHPRRSGGGCKPDVPPRADSTSTAQDNRHSPQGKKRHVLEGPEIHGSTSD